MRQDFAILALELKLLKTNLLIIGTYKFPSLSDLKFTLREKYSNMEFFLVRIFPYLDSIRRDKKYISVFSPNAEKYGPEKTPYLDTFHTLLKKVLKIKNILIFYRSTHDNILLIGNFNMIFDNPKFKDLIEDHEVSALI